MKKLKAVFHLVSVVSTTFAALNQAGIVPAKYAPYIAAASVLMSGILHAITRINPEIGQDVI